MRVCGVTYLAPHAHHVRSRSERPRLAPELEQRPAARHTFELVESALLEREGTAHDGAEYGARHEYLSVCCQPADARGDVHGHAADVLADQLALARVHPDAHVYAQLARGFGDCERAATRARGSAGTA